MPVWLSVFGQTWWDVKIRHNAALGTDRHMALLNALYILCLQLIQVLSRVSTSIINTKLFLNEQMGCSTVLYNDNQWFIVTLNDDTGAILHFVGTVLYLTIFLLLSFIIGAFKFTKRAD